MVARTDLLESALDSLTEGVALADQEGCISLWNHAAEAITGYESRRMAGRKVREILDALLVGGVRHWIRQTSADPTSPRGSLVRLRHHDGHELEVMARIVLLRDSLGERIGSGAVFYSAEATSRLPHGRIDEASNLTEGQAELEDRLTTMHGDFLRTQVPLGVLWVTVDQASGLRRTHGVGAVEAMMEKMERTLAAGIDSAAEIGRWGEDEFLVLSHEHNIAILAAHAQTLAGMARTTDFRWWGDRISLTVSIGAAQAQHGEDLGQLLERAQSAMLGSIHAGGNHVTAMQGRNLCSQS